MPPTASRQTASIERRLRSRTGGIRAAPLQHFLRSLERRTRQAPLNVVQVTTRAVDVARRAADRPALARLLRARAHALRAASRYGEAGRDYRASIRLFLGEDARDEAAISRIGLTDTLMYLGRYREAILEARKALRFFAAAGDATRRARVETNLGNIHHRRDEPAAALACYDRARRTFQRTGDSPALALVEFNRGNVLAGLGRLEAARGAYGQARRFFASERLSSRTGQVDYNLAYLDFLENRLPDALEALAALRPRLEGLGDDRHLALSRLDESEILLRLNLWDDAAVAARAAISGFEKLGMHYETARARAFLGMAELRRGDPDGAEREFREARRIMKAEGNLVWEGELGLSLARLDLSRGNWRAAIEWARLARQRLEPRPWHDGAGRARLAEAAAYRAMGRTGAAARSLGGAIAAARRLKSPWLLAEAHEMAGLLALDRGDHAAARHSLGRSIREIEKLRALLSGDDFRAGFLRDRDRPYVALARVELEAGRPREAFAILERGRSRALLDMIATVGARRRGGRAKGDARLVRVGKDAERLLEKLSRHYHQGALLGEKGQRRSLTATDETGERWSALESQATRLLIRLGREGSGGTVVPRIDERSIRSILAGDEALIAYFENAGRLGAFRIKAGEFRVFEDLAPAAEIAELAARLRFQWGRFRLDPGLLARHAGRLQAMARADLGRLHELLFARLDPETPRFVVVPTTDLRTVPFGALFDGRRYLAETRALSVCPGSSVFRACREAGEPSGGRALLVGAPDASAPQITTEVEDLRRRFPSGTVLLRDEATVDAFRREAPKHQLIHLAAHGIFRTDRPNLSGLKLADRWLYGYDVARLALGCRLVTLSACATGQSAAWGGGEWLGLARSFLSAGATRVLVSLWDVDDAATRSLMNAFYQIYLDNRKASDALAAAQTTLAGQGLHPYYWSGFTLMGDL